ncbi:hypothetical protein [Burkholderia gladioli]|uniref:hypothetical protein n=1 Tax=Burkholderia gladioli TaxID=28095 RepID=UPI00163F6583|nr:hypothetical protein [Burkholderia gladioli]MBU9172928.1 hypothetical protein [Burkholderia gladioli]MBU9385702.1 hypothetical protein [Burkholderia gladioli]MDN7807306.1 hypothetical protein [Burkholderia gladioli]
MNFTQQQTEKVIKARGGKVVSFDKDVSPVAFTHAMDRAQRQLAKMHRYGSRRVKVAVRRNGGLSLVDAVAAVRAALQLCV